MKAKTIKLSKIKPYPNNPRVNQAAVAVVRDSIERFGYQTPIVVDRQNVIICGHTRFEAIRELGWTEVEVLEADLTPEQAAEFRIVDNRMGELAQWNQDRLIDELRAVERDDVAAHFRPGEIDSLLAKAAGTSINPASQQEIDQAFREAETKFENRSSEAAADLELHAVTCRHCGKVFFVK